ncbi:MAG: PAS domain S-box protein [Anaerolineae bacterium]|nr:PAS domain S-box protein [Anaerolineae bacterium]
MSAKTTPVQNPPASTAPGHADNLYRALFTLSRDGMYRVAYDPPIDIHLPTEEQIHLTQKNGRLAECNDALAHQFGFADATTLIEQMRTTPPVSNAEVSQANREFILNGYYLRDLEITQHALDGALTTYTTNAVGIIENGYLTHAWYTQRDSTNRKQAEIRLQEYAARLEGQNKELAVLHQVAVAAANATSEDALIQNVTDIIGHALYPDIFGILLVDEEVGLLRPHPSYRGIDSSIKNQAVPANRGIAGYVAATGQPLRVNDVTQEPLYFPIAETIRSEMAVPIKVGGHVIALFDVESVQSEAFTQSDERILIICAGQLATAIERLRGKAKEQQRQIWLEKVLEIGKAITQITDWDTCIRQIHHTIRHELHFDRVGLFRYEPTDETVRGLLGTNRQGEPEDNSWFICPVANDNAFQLVVADPKGFVFYEDLSTIVQFPDDHEMAGVKNHATVAAWTGEKPIAVITVDNVISQRPMSDEQLEALRLFVGYAGLALANAQLLDQIRQTEEKYRSIFENSIEGIFQTAPDGRILNANPSMARLCGYNSPQELLNEASTTLSLYHNLQDRANIIAWLEHHDALQHYDVQITQKGGNLLWVSINARAIRDETGQLLFYEGTIHDINARKQAEAEREKLEAQLRQAQKMEAIGRLTGGIAHDFNNLLTVILSATDLLGRVEPEDENYGSREKWLTHIQQAGEKAAALIQQLLAFSRQQILELTIVNLNELIIPIKDMVQRLIGEDIELIVNLQPDLGRVKADFTQMEQVLLNLMVNARDAMPDGGKLMVQTENVQLEESYSRQVEGLLPGSYVLLSVSDTGMGMDAETKAHIFEPFFTTKEVGKGTGLGLATVYGIVRQFGGHIAVYSEPGMGATFRIYLPRVDAAATAISSTVSTNESWQGQETILVVEDDEMVLELVQDVLSQAGYHLLTSTATEAAALVTQYDGPIHLLLTDVVMPQLSGRDLAEQLTRLRPQLKVLYMSGYADVLIRHHGLIQSGLTFLAKPFTPETLTRKVRKLLDK